MTHLLNWDDLIIRDLAQPDCQQWLRYWSGWVTGQVQPIYMSKFGDWFLRHPDGSTSELSVPEGTYGKVAATPDEFLSLLTYFSFTNEGSFPAKDSAMVLPHTQCFPAGSTQSMP